MQPTGTYFLDSVGRKVEPIPKLKMTSFMLEREKVATRTSCQAHHILTYVYIMSKLSMDDTSVCDVPNDL